MGLVAAKCTQCGANIEVDNTKEAGICKYCGTAFITEKTITNYKISAEQVVVNGNNINISNYNIESALLAVEKFIKSELYDDANELIKQIIENYPYDYRGWWQMALLEYNQEGYWFDNNKNYQKALALAKNSEIIKTYRNKEHDKICQEGNDIIEFCQNPDINMLDKIYISVEETCEPYSHLSTKYIGLEVVENQLKQVEYERRNGKYLRWENGVVTLKAELSDYSSKISGNFYDQNGQKIPHLYISDIVDSQIVLSGILPKYYNIYYHGHIRAIKGDKLINLQTSNSDKIIVYAARIATTIICILVIIVMLAMASLS